MDRRLFMSLPLGIFAPKEVIGKKKRFVYYRDIIVDDIKYHETVSWKEGDLECSLSIKSSRVGSNVILDSERFMITKMIEDDKSFIEFLENLDYKEKNFYSYYVKDVGSVIG